jgi:hypothetical protein
LNDDPTRFGAADSPGPPVDPQADTKEWSAAPPIDGAIPIASDAAVPPPSPHAVGLAPQGEGRPPGRYRRTTNDGPNYAPLAFLLLGVLGVLVLGIVFVVLSGRGGGPLPTPTLPVVGAASQPPSSLPTFAQETPTPTVPATIAPTLIPTAVVTTPTPLPTVPWSIALQASQLSVFNGDEVTFTAFANRDVTGTGLVIQIFNPDTGVIHGSCVSGGQCQVSGRRQDITVRYQARVSAPDGSNVQATSEALTVTWAPAPVTPAPVTPAPTPAPTPPSTASPAAWSVTIAASQTSVANGELVTITATANQSVSGTGFVIQIFNPDTGFIHRSCAIGSSCEVSGRRVSITVRYQARISFIDGSNIQAQSEPVTVTWQ